MPPAVDRIKIFGNYDQAAKHWQATVTFVAWPSSYI